MSTTVMTAGMPYVRAWARDVDARARQGGQPLPAREVRRALARLTRAIRDGWARVVEDLDGDGLSGDVARTEAEAAVESCRLAVGLFRLAGLPDGGAGLADVERQATDLLALLAVPPRFDPARLAESEEAMRRGEGEDAELLLGGPGADRGA